MLAEFQMRYEAEHLNGSGNVRDESTKRCCMPRLKIPIVV